MNDVLPTDSPVYEIKTGKRGHIFWLYRAEDRIVSEMTHLEHRQSPSNASGISL
jgi:hypothetical protein